MMDVCSINTVLVMGEGWLSVPCTHHQCARFDLECVPPSIRHLDHRVRFQVVVVTVVEQSPLESVSTHPQITFTEGFEYASEGFQIFMRRPLVAPSAVTARDRSTRCLSADLPIRMLDRGFGSNPPCKLFIGNFSKYSMSTNHDGVDRTGGVVVIQQRL